MTNPETRIFCRLDGLTPAEREQKRLTALRELGLLETEIVTVFEEAAQTATRLVDAPIGILGVMAQNHLHIKSAVGLSRVGLMNKLAQSRLLPRSESFCSYVVDSHQVLAIHDTATHPVFASSLLVGHYGIRAYLGAPLLTADGLCLGTLAVMDWEPRSFSAKDLELLAITARWSLSEFERNRFLKQEYSSSIQTIPLSSTVSQYREGWECDTKLHSNIVVEADAQTPRHPDAQKMNVLRLNATSYESSTDRQDVSQDFSVCLNSGNSLKLQLLAQLTQELRTPLTSVMGMASVLTRQVYGPLTSKQKEYLEIIHRSGQHLISLLDEIVDLKILDEGSEQLQLTSVDIEMICQQAINSLSEIAQRQQLQIRLSVEPGNRIGLLDKDKVRQILYYLIYSVIHSAEAGGEVRLHASRKTDKINLAVWVSHPWLGEGLPPFSEDVAEPFLPSSTIAPGTLAKPIAAVSNALETSPGNSEMESSEMISTCYLSPADPVFSSTSLPVPLSLSSEPNNTPEKSASRENLGLLLSCHLAELHGGEISVQGSSEAGYRYVVTLPLFESMKERL